MNEPGMRLTTRPASGVVRSIRAEPPHVTEFVVGEPDGVEAGTNQQGASAAHWGSRFSTAAGHGRVLAVVGRSEAPMEVLVDHADVLHEGVLTRGSHEAVPLRLQLPGERFGLRR